MDLSETRSCIRTSFSIDQEPAEEGYTKIGKKYKHRRISDVTKRVTMTFRNSDVAEVIIPFRFAVEVSEIEYFNSKSKRYNNLFI